MSKKATRKTTAKKPTTTVEPQVTKPKVTKPTADKPPSALATIKALLIKNPKMGAAEIMAELTKAGLSCSASTVATVRGDFFHTIRALHAAGIALDLEV